MSALTPTPQVITADMLWTLTAQYPADEQRIWRGAAMVGLVERTATPNLWLVGSASDPDAAYQVDQCGCSCPDFQKRGGLCKHRAAVALFQQAERAEVDAEQWADHPYQDSPCDECGQPIHAEPICRHHRDGLGADCISRELFGEV